VAKNGDRSSVDLSVVNERPPTFIVNASVIVVAVLRQMTIVDELQRRLCRRIAKITSTRDQHGCFEKHAPHSDPIGLAYYGTITAIIRYVLSDLRQITR
jgi:hypothetical protein